MPMCDYTVRVTSAVATSNGPEVGDEKISISEELTSPTRNLNLTITSSISLHVQISTHERDGTFQRPNRTPAKPKIKKKTC